MSPSTSIGVACALVLAASSWSQQAPPQAAAEIVAARTAAGTSLALRGGDAFHTTTAPVSGLRGIAIEDSPVLVALWKERRPGGDVTPYYAITLDGQTMKRVRRTSYAVHLRRASFDPMEGEPDFGDSVIASGGKVHIVQFVCQPLPEFRAAIRALGGEVRNFFSSHCHLVEMNESTRAAVSRLPFVRWVGEYHPEYRLEPFLLENLGTSALAPSIRCYITVFERGPRQKLLVAEQLEQMGGEVEWMIDEGFRLGATLTPAQLTRLARMDEVLYIDRWVEPTLAMDNVRQIGGANHVESTAGYTGLGVRAEVCDHDMEATHAELVSNPVIFHGTSAGTTWHGTEVGGIMFSDGIVNAQSRGLLPDGQPISSWLNAVIQNRYTHTAELLLSPYEAVLQTNSWGTPLVSYYTSDSMELDDVIFRLDILILHAMHNTGSSSASAQAWAKNCIGVGGIRHQNTLTTADDTWSFSGAIGPAEDGRIKPDLAHWNDRIFTCAQGNTYVEFGGTSAATPITSGHAGLFYQMWGDGLFGNTLVGTTVFANRPHSATAKAMMINTADQYPFVGPTADLTRVHQGWGRVNAQTIHDDSGKMLIIDETDVLTNMTSISYNVVVPPGEPVFQATLVYRDLPGTVSASQHRINDLTLRVTDPAAIVYHGNNGLLDGNYSTSGGNSNTIDTVENVIVQNPVAGAWTVEVIADEINQDAHVATPALDATFGLVVRGIQGSGAPSNPCTAICGDCDQNGSMPTIIDAFTSAQIAALLLVPTMSQERCCDVDGSGAVQVVDALLIAQTAVGLTATLSCP